MQIVDAGMKHRNAWVLCAGIYKEFYIKAQRNTNLKATMKCSVVMAQQKQKLITKLI